MTALEVFTFHGNAVRTTVIDGAPWLVAADVANALGFVNTRDAITRHVPAAHKGVSGIATPSGEQQMTVIDEAGMYRLIMRANTDEAERFQEWVTAEVLPQIRRTGSYSVQPELAGAELLARAVLEAQSMLAAKDERIAELEPRAEVADRLLNADGDWSVGDAAKILSRRGVQVKERSLWPTLAARGWIFRAADGRWHVYSHAITQGVMSVIPQTHFHPRTGELVTDAPQCRVTPKGVERLFAAMTSTAVERAS